MFPDIIISKVPNRDYGKDGLSVHADHTSTGTVYFVSTTKKVPFPKHQHAEQWTVVVNGECRLTIGGETKTYRKDDTYRIPTNTPHQITLGSNYAEVDYVDDPND